jgi:hypothetical protein
MFTRILTRILSCWLLLASVSQAAVIDLTPRSSTLAALTTSGDSVQVGELVFSDFSYFRYGNMPTPASVQVTGYQNDGAFGISFSGDFRDAPYSYASGGRIWYTVTAPRPIVAAGLEVVGLDSKHVYNFARIDERLSYPNGTPVGQLAFVAVGEDVISFVDSAATSHAKLYAMTEIYLAGYGHDAAAFSGLHQSFTLQSNPEPSSLALACLAGFIHFVRRKL